MANVNPIELQKHLKGMEYPASRQDILDHVGDADADLRSTLERLPDEEYESPTDVSKAVGDLE